MGGFAWVTLATNDSYSLGALVLAHSLKSVGTTQQLAVLITPGVTNAMREKLQSVYNLVQEVNILDSRDEANLKLLKRPELGVTFTKLHCWRLTQYEKCVFLDADTLVLQNCDELFEREELSAAPDVGWPDCFNSGVFVYRPSRDTFEKLIQFALDKGSFDGGDQGLLNLYFSDWAHKDINKHLPFIYNMCSTACYSYLPAYKQFGSNAKIIHFIGATKPWLQYFNTETRKVQPSGDSGHLRDVLQRWWDIFCSLIHPQLSPDMAGLAGAFARLTLGVARTPEQDAFENVMRKQAWEVGNIDYMGKDSFDNIWSKISETLATAPVAAVPIKEAGELPKEVPKDTPAKSETAAPVESPRSETPFPVSAKIELPATPAVTDTVVSPPVQTLEPLKQEEPSKAEACIVTAVSATEIPSPTAELESESQTPAVEAERNLFGTKSEERIATQSAQPVLKDLPDKIPEQQIPESPQPEEKSTSVPVLDSSILQKSKKESSTQAEKPKESSVPVQAASEDIKSPVEEIKLLEQSKEAEVKGEVDALLRCNKPETAPSVAPLEGTKAELESVEVKPVSEIPTDSTKPELGPVEVKPVSEITTDSKKSESEHTSPQVTSAVPVECKKTETQSAEFKSALVEVKTSDTPSVEVKSEVVECQKTEINIAEMKSDSKPEPLESSPTQESQPKPLQEVPQSKVTEPTPPITPSTPPLTALPQFEKVKQALAVESNVPDTPPPSSSQDSSPTPPPRKEGKPKKVAASKPKK